MGYRTAKQQIQLKRAQAISAARRRRRGFRGMGANTGKVRSMKSVYNKKKNVAKGPKAPAFVHGKLYELPGHGTFVYNGHTKNFESTTLYRKQ